MRVLVVDDEPQLRRALERALKLEGYDVELAADGEQALGSIASATMDAIVLDVLMPKRDGLEVARELRARGDRTPILMLTASREPGTHPTGGPWSASSCPPSEATPRLRRWGRPRTPGART